MNELKDLLRSLRHDTPTRVTAEIAAALIEKLAAEVDGLRSRCEELQHFRSHSACNDCGSYDIRVSTVR